jgi:hypothetical protein
MSFNGKIGTSNFAGAESSSSTLAGAQSSSSTTPATSGSCLAHLLGARAEKESSAPDMLGENGDPCFSSLGFRNEHSEQLASDLLGLKQQLVGNDPEVISRIISTDWPKVVAGLSSMSPSDRQSHIVLLFKLCFFARAIRGQGNRSRVQFYLLFDKLREQFPAATLAVVKHIPHFGCFQDLDHLVQVYTTKGDGELATCLLSVYRESLFADVSRLLQVDARTMVTAPDSFNDLFGRMQGMAKDLRTMTMPKLKKFLTTLPAGDFSLAGKWVKREGKKNSKHRDDLILMMFPLITRTDSSFMNKGRQLLRYIGSVLSQCLVVTEQFMTRGISRGWSDIELQRVPSKATTLYRKALLNEDKHGGERSSLEDRRQCAQNTLKAILDGKLNGAQSDLKALADLIWDKMGRDYGSMCSTMSKGERDLINAQWKKMVEFVNQLIEDTLERDRILREEAVKAGETPPEPIRDPRAVLPVVDVSGSMSGAGVMHYAIAMGIVCASISTIPGKLITFSEKPEVFAFDPNADIFELFRQIKRCNWGMNTNLDATHRLLLSEMVQARESGASISTDFSLLVVTDGQFDTMVCWGNSGGRGYYGSDRGSSVTLADYDTYQARLEKSFTDAGFSVPMMVYWNMALSKPGFPAQSSTTGVKLVAGFSQTIMVEVMTGDYKTVVDEKTGAVKVSVTPLESFMKTMSDPYYDPIDETLRHYWASEDYGLPSAYQTPPRAQNPSFMEPPPAPKRVRSGRRMTFEDQDSVIENLEARLAQAKDKRIEQLKAELASLEMSTD